VSNGLDRVRRALEAAGVEFIDENGGGPGSAAAQAPSGLWGLIAGFSRKPLPASLDICCGICHRFTAMVERHVKLFKNGRNQAVRIPREFELPGEDAIIRKDGQRLIIEPAPPRSLLAVLKALPTLDEEFPPIEDLPAEPVDL
jgi:antitoxin VapB